MYHIISGLNRSLDDLDLLHDTHFKRFQQVLDGVMKNRQKDEDPRTRKAQTFAEHDYDALWRNSFGGGDPSMLLTTLTFLLCKILALRPEELRHLTMKNFEFSYNNIPDDLDMVLIRYLEVSSKNKQGGLKGVNRKRKLVEHYERVTDNIGFYYWLNEYLGRCPIYREILHYI